MFTYLNDTINIPGQTPIEYIYKGEQINNREQPYNKEYIEQLVNFSGIFFDNDINGINNVKNVISRDSVGSLILFRY